MKTLRIVFGLSLLSLVFFACSPDQSDPIQLGPESSSDISSNPQPTAGPPPSEDALAVESLEYIGAFRLPGGEEPPKTFAYSGNAMTFNPDGNPSNTQESLTGSLFVMGHERIAYGSLPDGNQIAEISIPSPVISRNIEDLNTAEFLQDFEDVLKGHFTHLEEIPRIGLTYLNRPETGPKLHFAWGQHLQEPGDPSHGWFESNLSAPNVQGFWFIGDQDAYSTTGYTFEIPASWAEAYFGGRYLATGRMRDGGMGGMGPALFAYRPWGTDGSAPADGTHLVEIPLLLYENALNSEEIIRNLNGYQHPDEWEGGEWITTSSGKQAVLFAGTKSTGEKYWYGFMHPEGAEYVCMDDKSFEYESMCRNADGSYCGAEDLRGCCDEDGGTCVSNRGWWSNRFDAQFILYDANDLAKVASGELEAWQPQPYAALDIDEHLYFSSPEWDAVELGWGDQRRSRIGDVAYDRDAARLYVLELYADNAKPIVHVWQIIDQ
jgi:hypothetical protein